MVAYNHDHDAVELEIRRVGMNNFLVVYLDESGDLGFNFANPKTPRYFVITLLVCENTEAKKIIEKAVIKTQKNKIKTKKSYTYELKGSSTHIDVKHYFYKQLSGVNHWHVYSIVLDKKSMQSKFQEIPPQERIYNFLAKEVLKAIDFTGLSKKLLLVVDQRQGKSMPTTLNFNEYVSLHLSSMLPLNVNYNISHEQSHINQGLQAVDLFSWGIYRSYEKGDNEWFDSYKDRVTLISANSLITGKKEDGP